MWALFFQTGWRRTPPVLGDRMADSARWRGSLPLRYP